MKSSTGILVAAAVALVSTGALARDDAVKTARKQADATYKMDKQACKPLKGDERDRCLHRAKAQHDQEVIEVKQMKEANEEQDKAERARGKEAKRAGKRPSSAVSRYESSAGGSSLPMPGSQSSLSELTADHPPASSMGDAPVSTNSPYTGDPKQDRPPK